MILVIYILKLLVLQNVLGTVFRQNCRALNNRCSDDLDCCSKRCVFSDESSTAVCRTKDVNLLNSATAVKNYGALEKCVVDGQGCLADIDCCSKRCYNFGYTTFQYCVSAESIGGQVKIKDESSSRKKCITAEKLCYRDAECCSESCRVFGVSIHRICAA